MTITAIDHIAWEHLGACYFSEEDAAFGTTGTERRAAPVGDSVSMKATQMMVDAKKLSPMVL